LKLLNVYYKKWLVQLVVHGCSSVVLLASQNLCCCHVVIVGGMNSKIHYIDVVLSSITTLEFLNIILHYHMLSRGDIQPNRDKMISWASLSLQKERG